MTLQVTTNNENGRVEAAAGFYCREEPQRRTQLSDFISLLRVAWLYAPDDAIRKLNAFAHIVHLDAKGASDEDRIRTPSAALLALGRDLVPNPFHWKPFPPGRSSTRLAEEDFLHLKVI